MNNLFLELFNDYNEKTLSYILQPCAVRYGDGESPQNDDYHCDVKIYKDYYYNQYGIIDFHDNVKKYFDYPSSLFNVDYAATNKMDPEVTIAYGQKLTAIYSDSSLTEEQRLERLHQAQIWYENQLQIKNNANLWDFFNGNLVDKPEDIENIENDYSKNTALDFYIQWVKKSSSLILSKFNKTACLSS